MFHSGYLREFSGTLLSPCGTIEGESPKEIDASWYRTSSNPQNCDSPTPDVWQKARDLDKHSSGSRNAKLVKFHPAGCGIARVVVQILILSASPLSTFACSVMFLGVPDPFIFKAESAQTQAPAQNPSPFLSRAVLNFHASCLK